MSSHRSVGLLAATPGTLSGPFCEIADDVATPEPGALRGGVFGVGYVTSPTPQVRVTTSAYVLRADLASGPAGQAQLTCHVAPDGDVAGSASGIAQVMPVGGFGVYAYGTAVRLDYLVVYERLP